jgi:transposase
MSGLIDYPTQIWVAVAPVDMRRGLDGLSAIVQQNLGHAPCAGSAFIFRNRAGNRLRLLLSRDNYAKNRYRGLTKYGSLDLFDSDCQCYSR